jgi:hypothetical protein
MFTRTTFITAVLGFAACGDDGTASSTEATTPTTMPTTPPTTTPPTPTEDATATTDTPTTGDTEGSATGSTTDGETGTTTTTEPPDTGETGEPTACVGDVQLLVLDRPKAVLVLDRSVRMVSDPWDHDANAQTPEVTRWSSIHAAVDAALAEHEAQYEVGAALYPGFGANNEYSLEACPVDPEVAVPAAANNRDEILAALPDASDETLAGGWPIAGALAVAYDHLRTFAPTDTRIAVLVLLHMPTCDVDAQDNTSLFEVYDEHAPAIAEQAFTADGIRTHVIALAATDAVTSDVQDNEPNGHNPVDRYGEFAAGAGTAFVNAADQAQLTAAVGAALASLPEADCRLALAAPLAHADQAEVHLGGAALPRVTDCAAEDGWTYVEAQPPYTEIELCGAACTDLFAVGEVEVEDCADAPG